MSGTSQNPVIIGLTGSFGSGCSYIAEHILEKEGFQKKSLSQTLRRLWEERNPGSKLPSVKKDERRLLQDFGDEVRQENAGILAEQVAKEIDSQSDSDVSWVVDSIRNPAEIHALRNYSSNFFLMGIYADRETRWERVRDIHFDGDRNAFDELDKNDQGNGSDPHGQRVGDSFYEADIILGNNKTFNAIGTSDFNVYKAKVKEYLDLISTSAKDTHEANIAIKDIEVLMSMALRPF